MAFSSSTQGAGVLYVAASLEKNFLWMEWGGAALPSPSGEGENAHVFYVVKGFSAGLLLSIYDQCSHVTIIDGFVSVHFNVFVLFY